MKFRDLFNKKNISRFLMLGIVLFLFLPLIYPEEKEFKIIKKENVYEHETSPLPIFKKDGLLGKYANKLKNFYKINLPILNSKDKKTNQITEYNDDTNLITQAYDKNQNIDITKEDLFFPSAFDNEDDVNLIGTNGNVANKNESNTVNLQKGTVLTNDGSTLEPTKEGYYYKGKFYKNGTYPKNVNKKHIEGALSRYHSSVAKKLGKKAVYLADENGNLTVSYENELPDQIATDIDTYLAQNQNKYQQIKPSQNNTSNTASEKYNQYEKYNNSQIVKSNNQQIDDSDISIASIKDMHSAYDLIKQKINTNQIGQGILPKDVVNSLPLGNVILNQTSTAQPSIENHEEEIYCHGDECKDSFRVAPIVSFSNGLSYSDLEEFYKSLCFNSCPYISAYVANPSDKPLNLDIHDNSTIDELKKAISESDKKIIEISYINPNKQNRELLTALKEMSLTNKNGEPLEIRLRGIEKIGDDASFGEKMVGPFKKNITRDLITDTQSEEATYQNLVDRYNKLDEEVQTKLAENPNLQVVREFYPNLNLYPPVAFVEKDKDENFFIINNVNIPKGYIKDIPQWEKYKIEEGIHSYYKVPKDVLFSPPSDLTIIAVQDGKNRDIVLQDGHPVGNISKEKLQNLYFKNVQSTKIEIADFQLKTIQYNIDKLEEENKKQ